MVSPESTESVAAGPEVVQSQLSPETSLPGDGASRRGLTRWLPRQPGGLWGHRDFVTLWTGQTVSQFGSHITLLALPLTAALTLDATPFQMGLLTATEYLPSLLIGLFAGVWVDRRRRRPLMIATDLGRAVLLLVIPTAFLTGWLGIEVLYAIALLGGTLSVFFDVASSSYLPSLLRGDQLVEGNSKLQASQSIAQAAGPGLAGLLVGLVKGPLAIGVDALSFVVSAWSISRIRTREPAPAPRSANARVIAEIREGLRAVVAHPILRPLTGCGIMTSLFGYVFLSVYVLYMARDLALAPALIGLILTLGGIGAFVGALLAEPAARRFGVGPAIIGAQFCFGTLGLFVPAAVLVRSIAVPLIALSECLQWLMYALYAVNQVSLRQALTPDHLRGRVSATSRFLVAGSVPVGALLGGALGGVIGLGPTLVVGVFGMMLGFLWVCFSPMRSLRTFPVSPSDAPWSEVG